MFICILILSCLGLVFGNTSCPDAWVADRGSCYLFIPERSLTYLDAQHYCTEHRSHLVVINDETEDRFLKSYLTRMLIRSWWIGLTDELVEGEWIWYPTGERPEYTDWIPGEPNSAGGAINEDCASMYHDSVRLEYKWVDIACARLLSPICEMEAERNPIIG